MRPDNDRKIDTRIEVLTEQHQKLVEKMAMAFVARLWASISPENFEHWTSGDEMKFCKAVFQRLEKEGLVR